MRIDEILLALHKDIEGWVKQRKGLLSIATDPWNILEILAGGPKGFQVILHWAGDEDVGEQPEQPLADNVLEVFVGYNLGLKAKPDMAIMLNTADRPSMLKYVNDLRARVLAFVFPGEVTMERLKYGGCQPVVMPDGTALAAYKFQVRLTAGVEVDEQLRGSVTEEE